jgi:hypothetical protein
LRTSSGPDILPEGPWLTDPGGEIAMTGFADG